MTKNEAIDRAIDRFVNTNAVLKDSMYPDVVSIIENNETILVLRTLKDPEVTTDGKD